MKLFLMFFLAVPALSLNHPTTNRGSHPYEFVRTGNRRVNDVGSKPSQIQEQISRSKPPFHGGEKHLPKKISGVPPYAVLMEPLVKYSQPDPLYDEKKGSGSTETKTEHKINKKDTKKDEHPEKQIASKSSYYEDQEGEATGLQFKKQRPQGIAWEVPGILYETLPTPPEPIIEIIIKESNESLPTPPPPPPPPPRKKKKEQVQVFYVKYKKDPSAHYGEEKIIYDAPVPAVTPPTNNQPEHNEHEEEAEEYYRQQLQHHYEEEATVPPRPSTTLKAIIKPDSEVYHSTGNVHITFGGPHDEEGHHGHHDHHHHHNPYLRGDHEEQSAPQPSVILPPKRKTGAIPRASSESQLTKRNPAPFHAQTQPPQQSFQSASVSPPREFHRPTPPPTFQQTPQFSAHQFKPQLPKIQPSHAPPSQTPPRPPTPTRYSTLPQQFQQFPKPQQTFSFPSQPRPHIPQQPIPQQPIQQPIQQPTVQSQQYYSINQPHLKSSFQVNQRPTPPQHYQTISNQAQQQQSFLKSQPVPQSPSPSIVSHPKPFPQQNFQQTHNSFPKPSNTFSQVPSHSVGPIIQRTPIHPAQSPLLNKPIVPPQQYQLQNSQQHQHQQQVEQLNRLQHHQQRLQSQILDQQQKQQNFFNQQKYQTAAPEIIKSVTPELPFANHRFETRKPQIQQNPTLRPQFPTTQRPSFQYNRNIGIATEKKYGQTTQSTVEYVTEDPKKAEEERRKKEERKKQNVAALPKEVPDDLREQLLSSDILSNADIQILDYDKIGDIPIESLPPEALANFQQAVGAGSEPVPSVVKPDSKQEDMLAEGSDQTSVVVSPNPQSEIMEMKVVRYNPDSKEGAQVPNQYVKEGATQLEPVVLNDSKYNRYLPLKVSGAQFPVPNVPELIGKNVTSVVVLAPVDYEFLQRHDDAIDEDARAGRRSSHPVLEVQGVHFVAGDVLKTLVKKPTAENYRRWLEKENRTALDKQSVVLLVIEPKNNATGAEKEIFMYDIGTQKVNKLSGELSAQFVEVAESNSENDDLEEISDNPGGDFTVKDTSELSPAHVRRQRKVAFTKAGKSKLKVLPR